jgi:hypothetical protein
MKPVWIWLYKWVNKKIDCWRATFLTAHGLWCVKLYSPPLHPFFGEIWKRGSLSLSKLFYASLSPFSLFWSISPTFFEWLFGRKVLCAAFLYLQYRFVLFCRKSIGAIGALKMLVKLTTSLLPSLSSLFSFSSSQMYFNFRIKSYFLYSFAKHKNNCHLNHHHD